MPPVPKIKKHKKKLKPKKIKLSDWCQLCDELWRIAIHVRDKSLCQYSLLDKGVKVLGSDAHHIFSRECKKTRFNLSNGILLKAMHNVSDAHKKPETFRRFLIEKWFQSEDKYNAVYRESCELAHLKEHDYIAWKEYLITSLRLLLKADPGYIPMVRTRMAENWLKKWDRIITEEEKMAIFP